MKARTLAIILFLFLPSASGWAGPANLKGKKDTRNTKISSTDIKEHEEIAKCYGIAHRVCPDAQDINKCLATKRNAFTTFCVDKLKEKSGDLKQMTQASDVSKCMQSLTKQCKLELPEAKVHPDKKALQAAVAKYQQCMNEKVLKNKDCDAAANRYAKEGAKKNNLKIIKKGGHVQLIKN